MYNQDNTLVKYISSYFSYIIMGKIISTRRSNAGLIFEIEVGHEEARALKGNYDDIYLFSENVAEFNTNVSSRGKNSVTKYFLIPRHLRSKIDWQCKVGCQKIENENNIFFIYIVDKTGLKVF